jgi:hypothetical protein
MPAPTDKMKIAQIWYKVLVFPMKVLDPYRYIMMAGNMKDTSALNRKRHEASLSR